MDEAAERESFYSAFMEIVNLRLEMLSAGQERRSELERIALEKIEVASGKEYFKKNGYSPEAIYLNALAGSLHVALPSPGEPFSNPMAVWEEECHSIFTLISSAHIRCTPPQGRSRKMMFGKKSAKYNLHLR